MKMDLGYGAFSHQSLPSSTRNGIMREILTHMGLMTETQLGRSVVRNKLTEFHCTMEYWDADHFNDTKLEAFLKV